MLTENDEPETVPPRPVVFFEVADLESEVRRDVFCLHFTLVNADHCA